MSGVTLLGDASHGEARGSSSRIIALPHSTREKDAEPRAKDCSAIATGGDVASHVVSAA